MNSEIKFLYKKKECISGQLLKAHLEAASAVHNDVWDTVKFELDEQLQVEFHNLKSRQDQKLKKLMRQIDCRVSNAQNVDNFQFYPRVVNETDISFNDEELRLLNKGLKFNVQPSLNDKTVKELIVATKMAVDVAKLNENEKGHVGYKLANAIKAVALEGNNE